MKKICRFVIVVAAFVMAASAYAQGPGPGPGPVPNVWTQNGSNIHNNNTGNVGIGVSAPTGKLEVKGGCINSDGTSSGKVSICPQNASGTYNLNLPTTAGTAKQSLISGGGGSSPMVWLNFPYATPQMFNASAGTGSDDTVAINAMIASANSLGTPMDGGGLTYKVTGTLSNAVDVAKTSLNHFIFNMTTATSITAPTPIISITSSDLDCNSQGATDSGHPFIGNVFNGPNSSANVDLFVYTPATTVCAVPGIAGVRMVDGGITGFRNMITLGDGAVAESWTNMQFGSTSTFRSGNVLKLTGSSNSGENLTFCNVFAVNLTAFIWDAIGSANSEVHDTCGGSADAVEWYLTGGATVGTAAALVQVDKQGGHMESNGTNGATAIVWSSTAVSMRDVNIVGVTSGAQPFRMDSGVGNVITEGLVLDGTILNTGFSTNYFVAGTGRVLTRNTRGLGNIGTVISSQANNLIPRWTLPSSGALAFGSHGIGWSSNAAGFYDTGNLPSFSDPVPIGDIAIPAGNTVTYRTFCVEGDWMSAGAWIKTSATGNIQFFVATSYYDAGGNQLSTTTWLGLFAASAYTHYYLNQHNNVAPPGAVYFELNFNAVGTTGTAYVSLPAIYRQ